MINNKKQNSLSSGHYVFFNEFENTSVWRSIRFRASLLSASCISVGVLLPFFLGFFLSLKQGETSHFLEYFGFITLISIIMCIPLSVFIVKTGLGLYNKIIEKNLRNFGF